MHCRNQGKFFGKMLTRIILTEYLVSVSQEEFLDLSVTVSGTSSLEDGLQNVYKDVEILDGKNQYKCGGCNKLVDAAKVGGFTFLLVSGHRFDFYNRLSVTIALPHSIRHRLYNCSYSIVFNKPQCSQCFLFFMFDKKNIPL